MKYSVIIPTFNSFGTIEETLKSVNNQTIIPDEILIIDDASDSSFLSYLYDIVQPFGKINISIFENNINQGPATCRNQGIERSRNLIIAFIDSDDTWESNKMEICLSSIKIYKPDILGHNYYLDNKKESALRKISVIKKFQILLKNPIQTSCLVITDKNLRFPDGKRYCEDYEFLLQAIFQGELNAIKIEEELTRLGRPQLTTGGLSQNWIKMRVGEIRAYYQSMLNTKYIILFPVLVIYSLIKFFLKLFKIL